MSETLAIEPRKIRRDSGGDYYIHKLNQVSNVLLYNIGRKYSYNITIDLGIYRVL